MLNTTFCGGCNHCLPQCIDPIAGLWYTDKMNLWSIARVEVVFFGMDDGRHAFERAEMTALEKVYYKQGLYAHHVV